MINLTIGERIRFVRKSENIHLTLEKFGERIGMKKSSLSQVENGINSATDQTIKAVCREFNVDYIWLTTGEGEPFIENDDYVADILDMIMKNEKEKHKNLFKLMSKLTENDLCAIENILDTYCEIKKEADD